MADTAGRTAQARFTGMLRLEIAPGLRALGFKGSGGRYVLPDDERWLLLAFQKNRYSRADSLTFTVNLTTVDKATWARARAEQPWLPEQPSGNAHYPVAKLSVIRLGTLISPRGGDRWWEVASDKETAGVSRELLETIQGLGVPWLRSS